MTFSTPAIRATQRLMKARQFERARQPITVSIGKKKYTALDWSPNGFQLPKGLAHGYEGKWYPVTLTINDPRSPVKMTGKAQPRWSTATHSGFYFKSDQDAANIPTWPNPGTNHENLPAIECG